MGWSHGGFCLELKLHWLHGWPSKNIKKFVRERILSWQIFCNKLFFKLILPCSLDAIWHFGLMDIFPWALYQWFYHHCQETAASCVILFEPSIKVVMLSKILNCCLFLLILCQVHSNPKSAAITICIFNNCTTNTDTSGTTFTTSLLHLMFAVKIGSLCLWLFVPSSFYIFPFYFLLVYVLFSIGIANNMILQLFFRSYAKWYYIPNNNGFTCHLIYS